jgi:hypothetical protein
MYFLITLLCLACVTLVAWGFTGRNRCLRFSSLMGASVAGFIVPQVIGLNNAQILPEGALEMFAIMAVLCMVAAFVGDQWGYQHPGSNLRLLGDFDERRVIEAALILNSVAIIAATLIYVMYGEEIARRSQLEGGASGPITIAIFFGSVLRYGFALAMLLFWKRQSALSLFLILIGVVNYLFLVVIQARRGPAMEFAFIVLITYALARHKAMPAWIITILFVGGTLWSSAITEFRDNDDSKGIVEKVETADYLKSFMVVLDQGGLEVRNGAEVISTCDSTDGFEFGKLHWNRFVHGYFPGQVFGYETKQELKFEIEDIAELANRRRGTVGVASTGMADCFTSFWYFGCAKYLVIGFVMGRWYRRAFQGDLAAQLSYASLMSAALHTISHGTTWLMNEYIHLAIFSYPMLYWARKPAQRAAGLLARRRRAASEPAGLASNVR